MAENGLVDVSEVIATDVEPVEVPVEDQEGITAALALRHSEYGVERLGIAVKAARHVHGAHAKLWRTIKNFRRVPVAYRARPSRPTIRLHA